METCVPFKGHLEIFDEQSVSKGYRKIGEIINVENKFIKES